jgi:hypothetical protein
MILIVLGLLPSLIGILPYAGIDLGRINEK